MAIEQTDLPGPEDALLRAHVLFPGTYLLKYGLSLPERCQRPYINLERTLECFEQCSPKILTF